MSLPHVQVVAGIIQNEQQQILIAKRMSHKPLGNLWEFPGGKIEPDETIFDALVRELFEEVDLKIFEAEPFLENNHDYGDKIVILNVWRVTKFSGIACGKEGQEIRWISINDLDHYSFPPANHQIIKTITS